MHALSCFVGAAHIALIPLDAPARGRVMDGAAAMVLVPLMIWTTAAAPRRAAPHMQLYLTPAGWLLGHATLMRYVYIRSVRPSLFSSQLRRCTTLHDTAGASAGQARPIGTGPGNLFQSRLTVCVKRLRCHPVCILMKLCWPMPGPDPSVSMHACMHGCGGCRRSSAPRAWPCAAWCVCGGLARSPGRECRWPTALLPVPSTMRMAAW